MDTKSNSDKLSRLESVGGLDLTDLTKDRQLPLNIITRLQEADKNNDGKLSASEIIQVITEEQQVRSEARLLRKFIWALSLATLLMIASLCGTVYAIVALTKEVHDDNNRLVSSSTGDLMDTGLARESFDSADLFSPEFLELMPEVETLVVPFDNGTFGMYKVAGMYVEPGVKAFIKSVEGRDILVDVNGVSVVGDVNVTGSARRLLGSGSSAVAIGQKGTINSKKNKNNKKKKDKGTANKGNGQMVTIAGEFTCPTITLQTKCYALKEDGTPDLSDVAASKPFGHRCADGRPPRGWNKHCSLGECTKGQFKGCNQPCVEGPYKNDQYFKKEDVVLNPTDLDFDYGSGEEFVCEEPNAARLYASV